MHRYNTILGEYKPAFFSVFLNFDLHDGDLSQMSTSDLSTFIHELVHYTQDLTTTYGLANICHIVELQKAMNGKILKGGAKRFSLPIQFRDSDPARVNIELFGLYSGYDRLDSDEIREVTGIEMTENGLIPGYESLPVINVGYKNNQGQGNFYFGSICILESMAHLIEQMLSPGVDHPDFPYKTAEYVADFLYPELSKSKLLLISLCDISLGHYHPGFLFFELLSKMKADNFLPSTYEDILVYCRSNFQFSNGAVNRDLLDFFEDSANMAKDFLPSYITTSNLRSVKEWLERTIESGLSIRRGDVGFWETILGHDARDQRLLAFKNVILNKIESPIMSDGNFQSYLMKSCPDLEKQIIAFLAVYEIHELLTTVNKKGCGLLEWCKKGSNGDITSKDCLNSPWSRARETELCPFGQIWRMWGMSEYEPISN